MSSKPKTQQRGSKRKTLEATDQVSKDQQDKDKENVDDTGGEKEATEVTEEQKTKSPERKRTTVQKKSAPTSTNLPLKVNPKPLLTKLKVMKLKIMTHQKRKLLALTRPTQSPLRALQQYIAITNN
jgi:hypothetical protein